MKVSPWFKYLCAHLVLQFGTFGQQLSSTEGPLDLAKYGQQSILRENKQSAYKTSSIYIAIKSRSPPFSIFYTYPRI